MEELGKKEEASLQKGEKIAEFNYINHGPDLKKHFKLTDKGFSDVLEISCRSQAHNLFAVGLNLGNGNYRCSSELT